MNDMTLGQYYPTESVIHRLDPRTKFICTLVFLISLFLFKSVSGYLMVIIYLAMIAFSSRVPLVHILKGLKPIMILIMATIIFQTLTSEGEAIAHLWIFTISYQGIRNAIYLSVRIISLVVGAAMLTYTTTPTSIADGIERMLAPLARIKVPVHELAFMILIAIKFIPILMDEADKIVKAQQSRGVNFEEGNLIQKGRNLIPVLVPIFIATFHRANELGVAMDARCYRGGEYRSVMNPLKYRTRDYICYTLFFIYMVGVVIISHVYPIHIWIF